VRLAALLAAAVAAFGQPSTLTNARLDTRSAAGGLDAAFRAAVAEQPQPAWVGYSVPASRAHGFGCGDGGTVYLEPPTEALMLFRVVDSRVERIRTLAPRCQIDAGGAPVRWLTGVAPEQSVKLLAGMASTAARGIEGAMGALGVHAHPSAVTALAALARESADRRVRSEAIGWLSRSNGVEQLIEIARTTRDTEVRREVMAALGRSRDPRAAAFFEQVLKAR
jgi:hypothetical protein